MKRLLILLLLLFSGCSATAAPDVDVKAFTNSPVPADLFELPGVEIVVYSLDSEKAKEFKIKKQCFIVCTTGKCIVVETLEELRKLIE